MAVRPRWKRAGVRLYLSPHFFQLLQSRRSHLFALSPNPAAHPWTAFSLRLIWVAMDAALSPDCIISSSWASFAGVQVGFANRDGVLIPPLPFSTFFRPQGLPDIPDR